MIIFVGSNPSNAAKNVEPFTPDTVSGRVLQSWINAAGILDITGQYNIRNTPTPNNRPLTKAEIKEALPKLKESLIGFTKIVALGRTAAYALGEAGIDHLELPHPSGLNRKLNCPFYVNECISKLRDYANPSQ